MVHLIGLLGPKAWKCDNPFPSSPTPGTSTFNNHQQQLVCVHNKNVRLVFNAHLQTGKITHTTSSTATTRIIWTSLPAAATTIYAPIPSTCHTALRHITDNDNYVIQIYTTDLTDSLTFVYVSSLLLLSFLLRCSWLQ